MEKKTKIYYPKIAIGNDAYFSVLLTREMLAEKETTNAGAVGSALDLTQIKNLEVKVRHKNSDSDPISVTLDPTRKGVFYAVLPAEKQTLGNCSLVIKFQTEETIVEGDTPKLMTHTLCLPICQIVPTEEYSSVNSPSRVHGQIALALRGEQGPKGDKGDKGDKGGSVRVYVDKETSLLYVDVGLENGAVPLEEALKRMPPETLEGIKTVLGIIPPKPAASAEQSNEEN